MTFSSNWYYIYIHSINFPIFNKKNKKKLKNFYFFIFLWYFVGSLTWKINKIEKTMFTKTPVTFVPKSPEKSEDIFGKLELRSIFFVFLTSAASGAEKSYNILNKKMSEKIKIFLRIWHFFFMKNLFFGQNFGVLM